jgi:hypothetical protein
LRERRYYHAEIVIHTFRRARLSADDRRIAMLKSAFGAFSGVFSTFHMRWGWPTVCHLQSPLPAAHQPSFLKPKYPAFIFLTYQLIKQKAESRLHGIQLLQSSDRRLTN